MELSLGSYTMVSVSPSMLASSALALAIRILDPGSKMSNVWSKTLSHYTRYKHGCIFLKIGERGGVVESLG